MTSTAPPESNEITVTYTESYDPEYVRHLEERAAHLINLKSKMDEIDQETRRRKIKKARDKARTKRKARKRASNTSKKRNR